MAHEIPDHRTDDGRWCRWSMCLVGDAVFGCPDGCRNLLDVDR